MTTFEERLIGGLYGAIIGDACGVPYEFKSPVQIPLRKDITFLEPTPGYKKTYPSVPYGTWSDDTSLILCLLDALMYIDPTQWTTIFVQNMLKWRFDGLHTVDGKKFDIGLQTSHALSELESGVQIEDRDDPDSYGNGGLMRSIACSLAASDEQIVEYLSRVHTRATHANDLSVTVSMVYSLMCFYLLHEPKLDVLEAMDKAFEYVGKLPEFAKSLEVLKQGEHKELTGSGYVVDSFWTAIMAVRTGKTYKAVIQHAIAYGNDTDTTACIAGGIAGIVYGYHQLPEEWLYELRGRKTISIFAQRLQDFHGNKIE